MNCYHFADEGILPLICKNTASVKLSKAKHNAGADVWNPFEDIEKDLKIGLLSMSQLYSFTTIILVTDETCTRDTLRHFSNVSPLVFIEFSG